MLASRVPARPTTLLPFLYATPTIARAFAQTARRRAAPPREGHDKVAPDPPAWRTSRAQKARAKAPTSDIPFGGGLDEPASLDDTDELETAQASRQRTLTDMERRAFQRLFSSLGEQEAARLERPPRRTDGQDTSQAPTASARGDEVERLLAEVEGSLPYTEPSVGENQVAQYPESLKGMAMRAEYTKAQLEQRQAVIDAAKAVGDENEELRREREELQRLLTALTGAATDLEVWDLLSRDVFPSMRLIQDLEDPREEHAPEAAVDAENTETEEPEIEILNLAEEQEADRNAAPQPKFSLLVRAYPALILSAMRMLTSRALYSPLILKLIPTIRDFGMGAYALGISTALYNEQLEFQWRIMHDVSGMIATLEEMSAAGIAADQQTVDILAQVYQYRLQALDGSMGNAARMVEQFVARTTDSERLNDWRNDIKSRLERQALEKLRRESGEKRMKEMGLLE